MNILNNLFVVFILGSVLNIDFAYSRKYQNKELETRTNYTEILTEESKMLRGNDSL